MDEISVKQQGHSANVKELYNVKDRLGAPVYADETGAVAGESFEKGDGLYARLQRAVGRYGVEQRGIERVPEDERTDTNLRKVATMWLSVNLVPPCFAVGALAPPVFGLGFGDSLLVIILMNILATIPVAFFSSCGARFGFRTVVLSRFYFGYYANKFIAVLNIMVCVGWSAVNTILGAQLITAVNGSVPSWAAILLLAIGTLLITVFGYRIVHIYEGWSWIPTLIVFLIVIGEFAHSGSFRNIPMRTGTAATGSVVSFAASILSFGIAWTSCAADYTVYQPANTSRRKIFAWTFAGLYTPFVFCQALGLAVATAIDTSQLELPIEQITNPCTLAYVNGSVGGLLDHVLTPPLGRFGQFCLVVLAISIVADNCPNIYSQAFSLQILARKTVAVPRFVWTIASTAIYVAIAIPGYYHFAVFIENMLLIIGYYTVIWIGVAIPEHFIFRRGEQGYDVSHYMYPDLLPPGIAAAAAFGVGIAGAVLGMSQVWFVGPIGKMIGEPPFGGDVGFELAFAFTFLSYCGFRTIERRIARR